MKHADVNTQIPLLRVNFIRFVQRTSQSSGSTIRTILGAHRRSTSSEIESMRWS
jgi:hypothetical protein